MNVHEVNEAVARRLGWKPRHYDATGPAIPDPDKVYFDRPDLAVWDWWHDATVDDLYWLYAHARQGEPARSLGSTLGVIGFVVDSPPSYVYSLDLVFARNSVAERLRVLWDGALVAAVHVLDEAGLERAMVDKGRRAMAVYAGAQPLYLTAEDYCRAFIAAMEVEDASGEPG